MRYTREVFSSWPRYLRLDFFYEHTHKQSQGRLALTVTASMSIQYPTHCTAPGRFQTSFRDKTVIRLVTRGLNSAKGSHVIGHCTLAPNLPRLQRDGLSRGWCGPWMCSWLPLGRKCDLYEFQRSDPRTDGRCTDGRCQSVRAPPSRLASASSDLFYFFDRPLVSQPSL